MGTVQRMPTEAMEGHKSNHTEATRWGERPESKAGVQTMWKEPPTGKMSSYMYMTRSFICTCFKCNCKRHFGCLSNQDSGRSSTSEGDGDTHGGHSHGVPRREHFCLIIGAVRCPIIPQYLSSSSLYSSSPQFSCCFLYIIQEHSPLLIFVICVS